MYMIITCLITDLETIWVQVCGTSEPLDSEIDLTLSWRSFFYKKRFFLDLHFFFLRFFKSSEFSIEAASILFFLFVLKPPLFIKCKSPEVLFHRITLK